MLGYSEDEMMGMPVLNIIPGHELERTEAALDAMFSGKVHTVNRVKQYRHKNGSLMWGLLSASTVLDNKGEVRYVVAQVINIQEQKLLEENLKLQNAALMQANEELEKFAFIASHDLKEPIRTVRAFTDYLLRDVEQGKLERVQQDKEFIDRACKRMTELIDDLLSLSRVGKSDIDLQPCQLNSLLDQVKEQLRSQIESSRATISIPEEDVVIFVDFVQMVLVFQNLIQNAIKFHRLGHSPKIMICAVRELDTIKISVEDNGIGIAEEHQHKIFGPFKKLHSNSEIEGSGMGLAIVSKIINRHRGTISVKSKENEGTTFSIILPVIKGSTQTKIDGIKKQTA